MIGALQWVEAIGIGIGITLVFIGIFALIQILK